MSQPNDSSSTGSPLNPYAPPQADLNDAPIPGASGEAVAFRERYIAHETSVRSIGSLQLLGAFLVGLAILGLVVASVSSQGGAIGVSRLLVILVFFLILTVALGVGLRRLQPWARWVTIALLALNAVQQLAVIGFALAGQNPGDRPVLFGSPIGLLIACYMLYLLLAPAAGVVFSREYRDVIAQTPQVKPRTPIEAKIALVLILLAVVGMVAFGLFR